MKEQDMRCIEQDLGYQERLELWKTIRDEIKSIHGHFQDIWNRCEAAKKGAGYADTRPCA